MNELYDLFTNNCKESGGNCLWLLSFITILGIIFRTLVVYLVVLLILRFAGKRELGQMTPFDFVLLLLLSNSVQNAMTGGDNSLNGGIIAAIVLICANYIVNFLASKNRSIRKFIEGSPTILIYHGKLIEKNLKEMTIDKEQLEEALREHSVAEIKDVGLAVLEIDGSISVLKNEEIPHQHLPHHHLKFLKRN